METYKVSQDRLNALKNLIDTDLFQIHQSYQDEFNITSNRLDHIEVTETQITFHDRGHDFGEGVIDGTFRITSKEL